MASFGFGAASGTGGEAHTAKFGRAIPFILAIAAGLMIGRCAASASVPQKKTWDGSRVTPVHQIPLKDELSQVIVPSESNPPPLSSRYTCAPCHDYDIIKTGLHFNAAGTSPAGRPGEPWIWVDERTGTQLPLSYRSWPGTWNPARLGVSAWDFTLLFGRHMTGGGIAEPDESEMTPESRWNVSGKAEINCLACHNASGLQSPSEWAKQVLRQNFRWAATAASGLGEVGGMASRLGPTWDIFDGPNPDDSEWAVAPFVRYHRDSFDSKHRALLDISYKPDDGRCLACHSATPAAARKFESDEDVHSAAGIKCVQCHRNDISHNMVRGYEGEAADNPPLPSEDFTCRACHLGGETAAGEKISAGRLGAPFPLHNGIPAVHFDRLACTVCHSGPMPARQATRVRTSRANRLGIYGIADWATQPPAIVAPVYFREKDGKLAPHRMTWPAFWAETKDGIVTPLRPEQVEAAAGDILYPEKSATRIITSLSNWAELDGTPALVIAGDVYEMNPDGMLIDAGRYSGPAESRGARDIDWVVKKDGRFLPIVPSFDPASGEASADPEALVQKILAALNLTESAPGKPVLLYKGVRYQIIEGSLDKSESKDAPGEGLRFRWLKEGKLYPFISEFEMGTIRSLTGGEQTLTEEQVGLVLKNLNEKSHVYVSGGKEYRISKAGRLESKTAKRTAPVAWPLAHQVRPAQQSLGVGGCTDCHSFGSNFFFAKVRSDGPLKTKNIVSRSASSFMGLTKPYHLAFGLSFFARPAYKALLFACLVVIGSILLIVFLVSLGRLAGLIENKR